MSAMGRWVAERAGIQGIDALCLRTDDLDSVCVRLGLVATSMSRLRPDGFELRWRLAGLERTIEGGLPFFIEWQIPAHAHPGHVDEAGAASLTRVVISGDPVELTRWVGDCERLAIEDGSPGIQVELSTSHFSPY